MRLADTSLGIVYLFNLVTVLTSYPRNVEDYTRPPNRGEENDRAKQILQVIMPTETSRQDRIVTWTRRTQSIGSGFATERPYYEPYSSQEFHRRQQNVRNGNVAARPKPRPNVSSDKLNLRFGTAEDPAVLCEENLSRASTLQTRRSPLPSQDANSKAQHVVRTDVKDTICSNSSFAKTTSTIGPTHNRTGYEPPSSLPRPPTTNKPVLTTSRSSASTTKALGGIVFPDRNHNLPFVPKTRCKGKTYCEDVGDDYPTDHIKRLLQTDSVQLRAYFGQDEMDEVNITHRIDVSDESPLCPSSQHTVYPKTAKNNDDNWMFIVNVDDNKQGFRAETCVQEGGNCALREELPWGYTFTCKQKYITRKMLALDKKNGEPVVDNFKLPSCCSCFFKANPKASRMGLGDKTSPAITPRQNTKARI